MSAKTIYVKQCVNKIQRELLLSEKNNREIQTSAKSNIMLRTMVSFW